MCISWTIKGLIMGCFYPYIVITLQISIRGEEIQKRKCAMILKYVRLSGHMQYSEGQQSNYTAPAYNSINQADIAINKMGATCGAGKLTAEPQLTISL